MSTGQGAVAVLGVILGDPDECVGGDDADEAGGEEPKVAVKEELDGEVEPDGGGEARDQEPAVEGVHRVLLAVLDLHREDSRDGGQEARGPRDEREEDAGQAEDREERRAQHHGAHVLGGGGLEEVRAAAGAVADVVADQVRDDGGVAGGVLGDAHFDLADQVRADVGGLGVDTTTELGEEGDEAGAEAEADDLADGTVLGVR